MHTHLLTKIYLRLKNILEAWPDDIVLIYFRFIFYILYFIHYLHWSASQPVLMPTVFLLIFSSFYFSCSIVSDSLWPHGLQHGRRPCLSPTPRVYSNSCRLSRWCHTTISSSVVPFSSCLQSFPELGSFHLSQLFTSGGQSIGVPDSTLVIPMNIQDWFPLGCTGWISL